MHRGTEDNEKEKGESCKGTRRKEKGARRAKPRQEKMAMLQETRHRTHEHHTAVLATFRVSVDPKFESKASSILQVFRVQEGNCVQKSQVSARAPSRNARRTCRGRCQGAAFFFADPVFSSR